MRVYSLLGYFLTGVGVAGLISYSASTFPALRWWAFWIAITISILFGFAVAVDDWACRYLELEYQAYIALLIGIAVILLVGGVIQWV